jgi:hypothetical protein
MYLCVSIILLLLLLLLYICLYPCIFTKGNLGILVNCFEKIFFVFSLQKYVLV